MTGEQRFAGSGLMGWWGKEGGGRAPSAGSSCRKESHPVSHNEAANAKTSVHCDPAAHCPQNIIAEKMVKRR